MKTLAIVALFAVGGCRTSSQAGEGSSTAASAKSMAASEDRNLDGGDKIIRFACRSEKPSANEIHADFYHNAEAPGKLVSAKVYGKDKSTAVELGSCLPAPGGIGCTADSSNLAAILRLPVTGHPTAVVNGGENGPSGTLVGKYVGRE